MYLRYKYCPHCDAELDADSEIFVQGNEVIGCDNCVRQTWADFDDEDGYDDDYDDEERDADIYDSIRDEMHIERVFGL